MAHGAKRFETERGEPASAQQQGRSGCPWGVSEHGAASVPYLRTIFRRAAASSGRFLPRAPKRAPPEVPPPWLPRRPPFCRPRAAPAPASLPHPRPTSVLMTWRWRLAPTRRRRRGPRASPRPRPRAASRRGRRSEQPARDPATRASPSRHASAFLRRRARRRVYPKRGVFFSLLSRENRSTIFSHRLTDAASTMATASWGRGLQRRDIGGGKGGRARPRGGSTRPALLRRAARSRLRSDVARPEVARHAMGFEAPPVGTLFVALAAPAGLGAYWWLAVVPSARKRLAREKRAGTLNEYLGDLERDESRKLERCTCQRANP